MDDCDEEEGSRTRHEALQGTQCAQSLWMRILRTDCKCQKDKDVLRSPSIKCVPFLQSPDGCNFLRRKGNRVSAGNLLNTAVYGNCTQGPTSESSLLCAHHKGSWTKNTVLWILFLFILFIFIFYFLHSFLKLPKLHSMCIVSTSYRSSNTTLVCIYELNSICMHIYIFIYLTLCVWVCFITCGNNKKHHKYISKTEAKLLVITLKNIWSTPDVIRISGIWTWEHLSF